MTYEEVQTFFDEGFPPGHNHYWKSSFLKELDEDAIDTIVRHFAKAPSPLCAIAFDFLGGAVTRVPKNATAFAHRDARYDILIIGRWNEPWKADRGIAWARALWNDMQPFSSGVYVNFMSQGEEDRVRSAYGSNYDRLAALKRKYDPDNLFRLNQNILPGGAGKGSGPRK